MTKKSQHPAVTIFLTLSLMLASGLIGHLWTKITYLENPPTAAAPTVAGANVPSAPTVQEPTKVEEVSNKDLLMGKKNARINLIVYTDFECPFCSRVHPTVKALLEKNKDNLNLVYRHFPLTNIHPKAQAMGQAVECVRKVGSDEKAWEYIDKLFADQSVAVDQLAKLAGDLGVNQARVQSCLDNNETKDIVDAGVTSGSASGVTGTPGGIIYDTKSKKARLIPGAVPEAQFQAVIDELLKS